MLSCNSIVFAAEKIGFQNIVFGSSFEEANKIVQEEFPHASFNAYERNVGKDLTSTWFKIGDEVFLATLFFDHNDKFYSYEISSSSEPATLFDSVVYDQGNFLTEIFKNKYGKPRKCFKPKFLNVKSGSISILCEWGKKDAEIFTGFSFNASSFCYYATARVTDKKMDKEFTEYKKGIRKKKALEGAKEF